MCSALRALWCIFSGRPLLPAIFIERGGPAPCSGLLPNHFSPQYWPGLPFGFVIFPLSPPCPPPFPTIGLGLFSVPERALAPLLFLGIRRLLQIKHHRCSLQDRVEDLFYLRLISRSHRGVVHARQQHGLDSSFFVGGGITGNDRSAALDVSFEGSFSAIVLNISGTFVPLLAEASKCRHPLLSAHVQASSLLTARCSSRSILFPVTAIKQSGAPRCLSSRTHFCAVENESAFVTS
jgi:hypothetical protein